MVERVVETWNSKMELGLASHHFIGENLDLAQLVSYCRSDFSWLESIKFYVTLVNFIVYKPVSSLLIWTQGDTAGESCNTVWHLYSTHETLALILSDVASD